MAAEEGQAAFQTAMCAWTTQNNLCTSKNNLQHSEWQAKVAEWELERDQAKHERRRPKWNKPKLGPLDQATPWPKLKDFVIREQDDGEDFTRDLEAIGEETEEEEGNDSN